MRSRNSQGGECHRYNLNQPLHELEIRLLIHLATVRAPKDTELTENLGKRGESGVM